MNAAKLGLVRVSPTTHRSTADLHQLGSKVRKATYNTSYERAVHLRTYALHLYTIAQYSMNPCVRLVRNGTCSTFALQAPYSCHMRPHEEDHVQDMHTPSSKHVKYFVDPERPYARPTTEEARKVRHSPAQDGLCTWTVHVVVCIYKHKCMHINMCIYISVLFHT